MPRSVSEVASGAAGALSAQRTLRRHRGLASRTYRLARPLLMRVGTAMSLPRQVLPGSFYMLTRRCTQRQFLLRPDPIANQTFVYCLAEAAQRFDIEIILPSAMSNHHHDVLFDRHGRANEFTEHFHKMLAKAMNAHRGRWENLWSSEPPCLVRLTDPADVLDKLVYAATNPVKDGLVERVHHWPGVNGLSALLNRRPLEARRPLQFFRANGKMPEHVVLELRIPPELGDPDEVRRQLRERVAAEEKRIADERRRTGKRVLGRRAILSQSWRDSPASCEPRRGLRPRIAARSKWSRVEAQRRCRAFLAAYRAARADWLAGRAALFPAGTYWLRRFANVPIAPFTTN
jgi:putative transposase